MVPAAMLPAGMVPAGKLSGVALSRAATASAAGRTGRTALGWVCVLFGTGLVATGCGAGSRRFSMSSPG
jgi:hypothetical protein